ncbi:type 1 glutamine amidotransferase domain-containing protein [Streptomyces calidiresistens]|uniref:Type 1 glutamine amidotransferase domain-containing protein n=1 Tax=Streptomyces calidiresistens TaxID=1485586 RepID=A0A7W3T448_9ACTN|nr:type 1 glutamine amidotransferase domain-containing protein [Streptomyces calidiresistens]MBB0230446.1 type 1 glutamine amidotransferase domain-containing protein [Streptomyces calidiresistens]
MPTTPTRGLIVLSNVERLPNGRPAGFWLPEAAYPWLALVSSGWDFLFAGTVGGRPPMGGVDTSDPPQRMFLEDGTVRARLEHTGAIGALNPSDFGVVFVAGGHGAILDLPDDEDLARFLAAHCARGGVIAAVCHGVGALLNVRTPAGGHLVAGRRVTCFTQAEERAVGLDRVVPYFLDEALRERGALYEAGEPFRSHVVVDGTLVTGQNPASAARLAAEAMRLAADASFPAGWARRRPQAVR